MFFKAEERKVSAAKSCVRIFPSPLQTLHFNLKCRVGNAYRIRVLVGNAHPTNNNL
jgi:hypothetical protein